MESKSISQHFRNKDLIEKGNLCFFRSEAPPSTDSRSNLNCVLLGHKMEKTYKGKNLKTTVNYMSYVSRIISRTWK